MRRFFGVFLIVVSLAITVNCQGGNDGGGNAGGGSSGSIGSDTSIGARTCIGRKCRSIGTALGITMLSLMAAVFASILVCCCCCRYYQGKPFRSNSRYVNQGAQKNNETELLDINLFQSGLWTSQYFKYMKWHRSNGFLLVFDPQEFKVSGSGTDEVGTFSIDGTYSIKTRRIGLIKKYQLGTGNPSENLGHTVIIQVEWNSKESQFLGKWYMHTNKSRGEDKFILRFDKQQDFSMDKNFEHHGVPF